MGNFIRKKMSACDLYKPLEKKQEYFDRTSKLTEEQYTKALDESMTIYVGNLSIYTREEAIYEFFSRLGDIKLLKMGLNKKTQVPCGFCFVEYHTRDDALGAVNVANRTML